MWVVPTSAPQAPAARAMPGRLVVPALASPWAPGCSQSVEYTVASISPETSRCASVLLLPLLSHSQTSTQGFPSRTWASSPVPLNWSLRLQGLWENSL